MRPTDCSRRSSANMPDMPDMPDMPAPQPAASPTRRDLLAVLAVSLLAGCGGGDDDAPAANTAREHASAALAAAGRAGFVFMGPTQTLQVGSDEQFIQLGSFVRVLVAPLTPGAVVYAAPGLPLPLADDDALRVAWPSALVLDASGARGFNLRCDGPSGAAVTLFLGV